PLTVTAAGEGLHRVVVGFFKVSVLCWTLSLLRRDLLALLGPGQPFHNKVYTAAALAICYSVYLYFNFSGYTDIVIGVGRYFGFRLPENFDRPFFADNFINF